MEKLLLHTAGINSILVEAMLNPQPDNTDGADAIGRDSHVEILVFNPETLRDKKCPEEKEPDMDALCGDWTGGRKRPALFIFKAAPGYMIALGKKPKKDETGECYLIHNVDGKLCFNAGKGTVCIACDAEKDTLTLFPGGEYARVQS